MWRRRRRARSGGDRAGRRRVVARRARRRRTARRAAHAGGACRRCGVGGCSSARFAMPAAPPCSPRAARFLGGRGAAEVGALLYPDAVITPEIAGFRSIAQRPRRKTRGARCCADGSNPPARRRRAAWSRTSRCREDVVEGALLQTRSRRPDPARPLHRRRRRAGRRDRVVQPPPAGAHPPPHARAAAPRDRAGHTRATSCASCIGGSTWRPASQLHGPGRHAADHPAAAGLRSFRRGVGSRVLRAPHGQVRARAARSALPFGRSDLGTALAASGVRGPGAWHGRLAEAGEAHAVGADLALPAR